MTEVNLRNIKFQPTYFDLVLAIIAAIALPVFCGYLYPLTGALLPLVVYYGVFCFGIVKWRKGGLDYHLEKGNLRSQFSQYLTPLFFFMLIVQLVLVTSTWFTLLRVESIDHLGFILTFFIWAPLNAFSEQLIWLYVFSAFAEFYYKGRNRIVMTIIGTILYLALIGLIHALFWSLFLLESHPVFPFYQIFFGLQFVISLGYILLYREAKSMWPIATLHLLVNTTGVLFTGYSILPFLLPFS